jgi:hypothetical protein
MSAYRETPRAARWLSLFLLTLLTLGASSFGSRAEARPRTYYKYIRKTPPKTQKKMRPAFGKRWMRPDLRRTVDARTERLLERARKRVAPHKPSRLNSVFAATDPKLWLAQMGDLGSRKLIKLQAADPKKVTVVDARRYERVYKTLMGFDNARTFSDKRRIVKKARKAAEAYWTKPATGKRALPEVLLGGGAIYRGLATESR